MMAQNAKKKNFVSVIRTWGGAWDEVEANNLKVEFKGRIATRKKAASIYEPQFANLVRSMKARVNRMGMTTKLFQTQNLYPNSGIRHGTIECILGKSGRL